jgi:putative aldouronate transport system substrate-binding protein
MTPRINRRNLIAAVPAGAAALAGINRTLAAPNPGAALQAATPALATPAVDADVATLTAPAANKYDPPIEVTTVATAWPTIIYPPGDDINNNVWTRAYESRYGIKVKTEWAVPSDQYEQRVNLMLTSGDMPDYFQANPTQFKQMADEGVIEDLTDVYNAATDRVKAAVTLGGPIPLDSATIDGRIMAIPHSTVAKEGASVLWVRTDWLEKVGMQAPTTIDELSALAEAFVAQDANGQGNTVGLGMNNDLSYATGFFAGQGAYREIWLDDGTGKLVYSSTMPQMKDALAKLQALYASGAIDLEFGTKNGQKIWEDIAAGRVGFYYGSGYDGPGPLQPSKVNFPDCDWQALPIPTLTAGEIPSPLASLGIAGYWVAKKGFEHPEAMTAMIDFWIAAFYDSTNDEVYDTFNVGPGDANSIWRMNAIQVVKPFKNLDVSRAITAVINSGTDDLSTLNAEGRGYYKLIQSWLQDGVVDGWGWNAIYGPGGAMPVVIGGYVEQDNFTQSAFYGAPTPTMVTSQATLDTQEIETFTRIIQGESIDSFDEFVQTWNALGGETITNEVNEWVQAQ